MGLLRETSIIPAATGLLDRNARYGIAVVSPRNNLHGEAFREVADTIYHGMRNFGLTVVAGNQAFEPGCVPIIFGANLLPSSIQLPARSIIFNLEQIASDSDWVGDSYLALLSRYVVWDYSLSNIEALGHFGITNVQYMRIGYVKALERITSAKKNIDVLFYGSMNHRRKRVIEGLQKAGLTVVAVSGVYGHQRDELVARARIVLNVHYYESKIFEIARVFYLLANRACVVSEDGLDPMEREFAAGVSFVSYDRIVERCIDLISMPEQRDRLAQRGYEIIKARPQEKYISGLCPDTGTGSLDKVSMSELSG